MDGLAHPENTGVADFPGGARDPYAVDEHAADATREPSAQKRGLDDAPEDDLAREAKRIHVEEDEQDDDDDDDDDDDADDLDLDALMAQLQQHTEQAGSAEPEQATHNDYSKDAQVEESREQRDEEPDRGHKPDSEPEPQSEQQRTDPEPKHDSESQPAARDDQSTELSIEQQLKGALSSFQDFGLMDHENDSQDDDAFGLGQFSEMLRQSDQNRQQQRSENEAREAAADKPSSHPEGQATTADSTLQPGAAPHDKSPSQSDDTKSEKSHPEGERPQRDTESKHGLSKEDLAAQMPPLPARGGQLPPMPPPPAALTTPTAPLTAEERHQLGRAASSADRDHARTETDLARSNLPPSKPKTRLPEAPPKLSESYEKSLVEQVEEAQRADEQSHPRVALLSENQAILQARRKSVAVLDTLAAQILEALGCNHYQETLATVTQPNSEKGLAYRLLLDAFEDAKRLFLMHASPSSRNGPESKPDEVRPFLEHNISGIEATRENIVTIQRANLATFVAAVFGTIEVGFWELDKWFVQAFVPEGGRMLKQQATIYLDLKTQAYISAVESTTDEDARKAAINDLFPPNLDEKLCEMFGDSRLTLAPAERDFVEKCKRRRENIEAEDAKDLSSKYHWVPFLRELSDYVQKNHYTLLPPRHKFSSGGDTAASSPSAGQQQYVHAPVPTSRTVPTRRAVPPGAPTAPSPSAGVTRPPQASRRTSSPRPTRPTQPQATISNSDAVTHETGPKAEIQEALTASRANEQHQRRSSSDSSHQQHSESASPIEVSARPDVQQVQPSDAQQGAQPSEEPQNATSQDRPGLPPVGHPMFPPLPKQVLPPPGVASNDTNERSSERARRPGPRPASDAPLVDGPTDTLAAYEAARASAEGTDAVRPRASMFTTRRTWTKEEEEALMKGMDRVQGPYWAQILELYGPGGKISEVLKDRSQVQLKDKARNLKMFFVRLGLPIPAVFQYVTGDYETRKSSGKRIRERKQKPVQGQSSSIASPTASPMTTMTTASATFGNGSAPPPGASNVVHSQQPAHVSSTAQLQSQSVVPSSTVSQENPPVLEQQQVHLPSQLETQSQPQIPLQEAQLQTSDNSSSAPSGSATSNPADNGKQAPQHNEHPSGNNSGDDNASTSQDARKDLEQVSVQAGSSNSEEQSRASLEKAQAAENEIRVEVREVHRAEKQADFGELFPDGDDKEEDLNSLLTRVGEFVDNH